MRTSRKALAASFVVTFAAGAAGCDAKTSSQQPPASPTVDVAPASASATPPPAPGDSSAAASSSAVQAPPPAPSFGRVERQPDGTCMWFADVHCPRTANGRIIPCNPPPPHKVQCPSDGGT